MGVLFSRLYNLFEYFGGSGRNSKIVMLGFDGAGKTTILYKVKLNETVTTIPTIGMNVETVTPSSGVTFTVWDMGGQDKIRCLWRRYFQCSEGIIFVVDSSDRERIQEVKEELFEMLESESLSGVPVQIIANKQDLSSHHRLLSKYDYSSENNNMSKDGEALNIEHEIWTLTKNLPNIVDVDGSNSGHDAMTPDDVTDKLQLTSLCGHKWHVQGACATTGDGVVEAFESMSCLVKDFNRTRSSH